MRVAVVTPYYKEAEAVLRQCHDSVLQQTVRCDHLLIADGYPQMAIDTWNAMHFVLPFSHADIGNTPRVLGSLSAFNLGYDAVAFLDADNWYCPTHIEKMVDLHSRTGAIVCTSNRSMHRPDGSYMFDDDKNDGVDHVDTNCYFLTRACMHTISRWAMMPKQLAPISDTIYLQTIIRGKLPRAHSPAPTVCYRTTWESDFHRLGEPLPEGVKYLGMTTEPFRWFKTLPSAQRRHIRAELNWPLAWPTRIKRKLKSLSGRVTRIDPMRRSEIGDA